MAEKRASGVSAKVADAFMKNDGQTLTIFDLIRITGLKPNQIMNSIAQFRSRSESELKNIEVIVRGQLYKYDSGRAVQYDPPQDQPKPKPEPELTEDDDWIELRMVGTNKAGRAIVEDEDGKLYTLEEL